MIQAALQQRLSELAEPSYCQFLKKLKVSDYHIYGVRSSHIHTIAKQLAKDEGEKAFLIMLDYTQLSYEEVLILYRLFGLIDFSVEKRLAYLNLLLKHNHSWATNDTLSSALSCIAGEKEQYYDYLCALLHRQNPYDVRLGVVTLMLYYLEAPYFDQVLDALSNICPDHYYVMMALGWAYATAYCKNPERTLPYLIEENQLLGQQVRKKALQKIIESNQVSDEEKLYIKSLRKAPSKHCKTTYVQE